MLLLVVLGISVVAYFVNRCELINKILWLIVCHTLISMPIFGGAFEMDFVLRCDEMDKLFVVVVVVRREREFYDRIGYSVTSFQSFSRVLTNFIDTKRKHILCHVYVNDLPCRLTSWAGIVHILIGRRCQRSWRICCECCHGCVAKFAILFLVHVTIVRMQYQTANVWWLCGWLRWDCVSHKLLEWGLDTKTEATK